MLWWNPKTLQMFYRSRLNSIVNRGRKVVGVRQTGLRELDENKTTRKGLQIMNDLCHILSL